jgi:hypothetical protein
MGCSRLQPNNKDYATTDYLENQFASHDLCDETFEWRMETTVQDLLASTDETPAGKVRSCDSKFVEIEKYLWTTWCFKRKLQASSKETTGATGTPFNPYFWLSHFPKPSKEATPPPPDTLQLFPRWRSSKAVKLTTHLHSVSRSRLTELYLHWPIPFHGGVLNWLNQVITLSQAFMASKLCDRLLKDKRKPLLVHSVHCSW